MDAGAAIAAIAENYKGCVDIRNAAKLTATRPRQRGRVGSEPPTWMR